MKIHTQRESTRTSVSTCHSNKKRCKRCIRTKLIKRHIVLVKVSKVDITGRTTACVKGCIDTKEGITMTRKWINEIDQKHLNLTKGVR